MSDDSTLSYLAIVIAILVAIPMIVITLQTRAESIRSRDERARLGEVLKQTKGIETNLRGVGLLAEAILALDAKVSDNMVICDYHRRNGALLEEVVEGIHQKNRFALLRSLNEALLFSPNGVVRRRAFQQLGTNAGDAHSLMLMCEVIADMDAKDPDKKGFLELCEALSQRISSVRGE